MGTLRRAAQPRLVPCSTVEIFGHRGSGCSVVGGNSEFAENSMAAFEHAARVGIMGVEIDVWLTRDDEVVVIHGGGGDTDGFLRETVVGLVPNAAKSQASAQSILSLAAFGTGLTVAAGPGVQSDEARPHAPQPRSHRPGSKCESRSHLPLLDSIGLNVLDLRIEQLNYRSSKSEGGLRLRRPWVAFEKSWGRSPIPPTLAAALPCAGRNLSLNSPEEYFKARIQYLLDVEHSNQCVPLLKDVLARFRGRLVFNVELKGTNPRLAEKCVALAAEFPGTIRRFSSFLWLTEEVSSNFRADADNGTTTDSPAPSTQTADLSLVQTPPRSLSSSASAEKCNAGAIIDSPAVLRTASTAASGNTSKTPRDGDVGEVSCVAGGGARGNCLWHKDRFACRETCAALAQVMADERAKEYEWVVFQNASVAQLTTPADVTNFPNGKISSDLMRPLVGNTAGVELALLYGGYRLPSFCQIEADLARYGAQWVHVPYSFALTDGEDRAAARELEGALYADSVARELLATFPSAADGSPTDTRGGVYRELVVQETLNLWALVRRMRQGRRKTLVYGLRGFEAFARLELALLAGVDGLCPNDISTAKKLVDRHVSFRGCGSEDHLEGSSLDSEAPFQRVSTDCA